MNKLWLIIKREYLIRVQKKTFLIITLLAPIAFAILTFGMGFLSAYMAKDTSQKVLVKDNSHIFQKYISSKNDKDIVFSEKSLAELKKSYADEGYDIFVHIPEYDGKSDKFIVKYNSVKKPGLIVLEKFERKISRALKDYKIDKSGIDRALYDSFTVDVSMEDAASESKETGDKTGKISVILATALAFVMGFLLYMVIFIFGTQVQRSVMEEKVNRIVEIILSSVKPFELMLGKILGVAAVGLTQLLIWVIFIPVIMVLASMFFGDSSQATEVADMANQIDPTVLEEFPINQIIEEFFSLNWWLILPSFILFFLGGYLLYSSMFAAVGAAIGDDIGESQSLVLPITLPVIFGMVIMMNAVNDPDSKLAVFGSIFPFFSPLVMPARLPFEPPIWQVFVSIVLLLLTSIFFVWISGRIYRGGILMYGKKLTFKEMGKLLFKKG